MIVYNNVASGIVGIQGHNVDAQTVYVNGERVSVEATTTKAERETARITAVIPAWPQMDYTADVVIIAPHKGELCVLMVRRGKDSDAFAGYDALPGGYVDAGETAREAAYRECREETGLDLKALGVELELIGIYDEPDRDPRGRVVSTAFVAQLETSVQVTGADDADEAFWLPIVDGWSNRHPLAFDHKEIVRDAVLKLEL